MKKILVTGATGFIGQYVTAELLRRGYSVIASSAHPDRASRMPWISKVDYIPLDLSGLDPDADYFRFLGCPDAMIHLAWEGLPRYKENFHLEVNLPRHVFLLENLVRHGLGDLTVIGTCLEYGMREGALTEDLPAAPGNPYAIAKDRLRQHLQVLRSAFPFNFRWLRLFYMYGKGQNPNSLFSQLEKALAENAPVFNMSGGQQVRDFLPVETMAAYIIDVAIQDGVTGIINICSGRPVSVLEMVKTYLRQSGRTIPLNPGYYPYPDYEPMSFWGDDTKLRSTWNETHK